MTKKIQWWLLWHYWKMLTNSAYRRHLAKEDEMDRRKAHEDIREDGLMGDFKCDSDDCGGFVCIYHGLGHETKEHIDKLQARIWDEVKDGQAERSRCLELEAEIENLKKDAAPFQAQIDQRKTYKGPDEQS